MRSSSGGDQFEAQFRQPLGQEDSVTFIAVAHRYEDGAAIWQIMTGGDVGFGEGGTELFVYAHHLTGGLHLGAEQDVYARELAEGEHRTLDCHVWRLDFLSEAELLQTLAYHDAGGNFGQWYTYGFRYIRHGARCSRVDFQHI